jgi:hypothetical protein
MQNFQVITSSGSSQFSWHSEFFWYTIDLRFQVGILSILFEGAKFKAQHCIGAFVLLIQKNASVELMFS